MNKKAQMQSSLSFSCGVKSTMAKSPVEVNLIPIEATPETFAEYGQVIEASRDGAGYGPNDAQLDLSKGIPRYSFPIL